LRLFLQIVEAASITHGARRAHLALAAASTRVRNLEFHSTLSSMAAQLAMLDATF
jgi:Bacterial regulatory helix-turn-helix protein, lysR family